MLKKMVAPKYPPRQWAIYGDAGSGKSRFASQMKMPAIILDADGRFTEQLKYAAGDVYQLSDEHTDNTDADSIARLLDKELPGSGVRTIVVDSLTAILRPQINTAMSDIEHGRVKNKISAYRGKAMTMALLQDSVTKSGADTLWIWHTHESMNANAQKIQRASIPETELIRLRRSLNAILKLEVAPDGTRSVLIEWARNGKSGIRLVDKAGGWVGMPEMLEAAMYSEGVKENTTPRSFTGPQDAISWGYEQGCFNASQHAQNAYEELKRNSPPKNAQDMWDKWLAEVAKRVAEKNAPPAEDEDEDPARLFDVPDGYTSLVPA